MRFGSGAGAGDRPGDHNLGGNNGKEPCNVLVKHAVRILIQVLDDAR